MQARDVMTTEIVSVGPETPSPEIATLLLRRGISAVPVVDGDGAPIGMVSEGDLVGRSEAEREARRDWWLTLLAEGQTLSPEFIASLRTPQHKAREIMAAPVITVGETTELAEIARLLAAHRIKRVPVIRDGRLVGIVSRADILAALAKEPSGTVVRSSPRPSVGVGSAGKHDHTASRAPSDGGHAEREEGPLRAADFRTLVDDFKHQEFREQQEARRAAAEERQQKVKELVEEHISDETWRHILHDARETAQRGAKEFLLLRFPSQLCSDGGRAVNAPDPDWPKTLRGEAAEFHARWQRDLKPAGFHLMARVLEFPGGMPGDIGLFLAWGE
jgi:CBS domain-containing protein